MEKHACKLCFRRFSNGRALGGHMRSHVAAASSPSTSSSFSQDGSEAAVPPGYGLRENPKRSFRLVDPEFDAGAGAGSSVVVQDRESETESPNHRRSRRSKRRRLRQPEPEPASSVSDTTPEEDVALSLMMLSRDFWSRSDGSEEEEDDGGFDEPIAARSSTRRSRFQCGTCKKVFRSYQALGGHRASHKKEARGCGGHAGGGIQSPAIPNRQIHEAECSEVNADKIHECPVCFRVFGSGQALGGHKRSHFALTSSPAHPPPPATASIPTRKLTECSIDLNLPAPIDDDVELSAVSDAEFVRRPN